MSARTTNLLENHGMLLMRDLYKENLETLLSIKYFGDKALDEIKKVMRAHGVPPPEPWEDEKLIQNILRQLGLELAQSRRPRED